MMTPDASLCPAHLRESLARYADDGVPAGGFLRFVLENDLAGAVSSADPTSLALLPHIVAFVRDYLPSAIVGSPAAVERHLASKRRERADAKRRCGPYAGFIAGGTMHAIAKETGNNFSSVCANVIAENAQRCDVFGVAQSFLGVSLCRACVAAIESTVRT